MTLKIHQNVVWIIYPAVGCLLSVHVLLFLLDVVYCPRRDCGSAVIREKSSKAAMCSVCGFAFCVACRKTYHGAGSCQDEQTLGPNAENKTEQGKLQLPKSKGANKYFILIKVIVSARSPYVYNAKYVRLEASLHIRLYCPRQ